MNPGMRLLLKYIYCIETPFVKNVQVYEKEKEKEKVK